MLIWFLIWAFSVGMPRQQDGLTLTMLDVRQGASFVLRTPNGKTILYDCGTFGSRDVGEQVVAPFLWKKGITKIDTLILSHSHLDHINGVPSILELFPVKNAFVNWYFEGSREGLNMAEKIESYNIPVRWLGYKDTIELDSAVTAEILSPVQSVITCLYYYKPDHDDNDLSLVWKIHYKNKAVLLTGDIQAEGLKALFDSNKDLSADILQIPHHGFAIKPTERANGQNSPNYLEELINRVTPSEIVINTDGDETDESILEICRARDIIIHSSDKDGAVTINLR